MKIKRLQAIEFRQNGDYAASCQLLKELIAQNPDNAELLYQCAWSHDTAGLEVEAVPYYEKAIQLGLEESDLSEAYLGLGSTYRTIGAYQKSKQLYLEVLKKFPENKVYPIFLAMTYYNLAEYSQAMELLLRTISEIETDSEIKTYQKAIAFYADKLDQIW